MKYALKFLVTYGYLSSKTSLSDARCKLYFPKKDTTIGIIGGLSPEIASEFYLKLIEMSRKYRNSYPHIIIDSVPLDFSVEDEMIIQAKNQQKLLPFLKDSVKRLQNTDFIVMPCNTAHIFIEELRKQSNVPIISIVEEVVNQIKSCEYRKAALLATSSTIKSGIYSDKEIEFLLPSAHDQKEISKAIVKIIRNKITKKDKTKLERTVKRLQQKCDAVVLACTDLRGALKGNYLDSFDILVESTIERIAEKVKKKPDQ